MQSVDVVIIGAGVMGAAAACAVVRAGAQVALIDQATLPNPRAASVDYSKVFRFAYADALYAEMAVESLAMWRAIEAETGAHLLSPTGMLMIGKADSQLEKEIHDTLRTAGLAAEMMSNWETVARFPQFNVEAFAHSAYDPSGAILHAERCVQTLIELARGRGARVIENARVTAIKQGHNARVIVTTEVGDEFDCERALVASGPWTRSLLPQLSAALKPTRQEIVYFAPPAVVTHQFEIGRLPIFMDFTSGFYGFPMHEIGAVKIGNHHKGEAVNPYACANEVSEAFIASCRAFFVEAIPSLAEAEVRETRVCIYNNTPDDDFIIDWHPEFENVLIATGFSGHGFKFGPLVGQLAADMLLTDHAADTLRRFRLARFDKF
jgi:monomeric sarcosine oxidase